MAKTGQVSPKVLASRRNGRLGGLARAAKYKKEEIKAWGRKGGEATSALYGSDFKKFMSSRRKVVGRNRKPVAETLLGQRKPKHSTVVKRKKENNLKEAA